MLLLNALVLAGCAGPQSALDAAGSGARTLSLLFWVMLGASALIWCAVMALAFYARAHTPGETSVANARRLIVYGGVVFPVITVTALLIYGLSLLPALTAPGDGLPITVSGEQWWWRVR